MHAFIEADMGDKPALQPRAAIGPAVRAIAGHIIDTARVTITDPERSNQDAVHDFRRTMKEWRALMRLLEPFIWRRSLDLTVLEEIQAMKARIDARANRELGKGKSDRVAGQVTKRLEARDKR